MTHFLFRGGLAIVAAAAAFTPAAASTDGSSANWSLSEFGGAPAQRQMLFGGTPGVLMGTSPASLLFIGWRRMHGQIVGTAAGEALAVPCCGDASAADPAAAWLDARKAVPGAAALSGPLSTERPGPDYTSLPNCLADAFSNAAHTLQDRIASYSAGSPDVQAWLAAQDAVFTACAAPVAGLPALSEAAPAWLRADHQYQAAALDFYNGTYPAAADGFAAIAADTTSPWHGIAPYLRVRALLRQALATHAAADFVAAHAAAQAVPPAAKLADMAQLHADPTAAASRLVAALGTPDLSAQAASDFKDLQSLGRTTARPELLDWIATFKTGAAAPPVAPPDSATKLDAAKAAEGRRVVALAHAQDRYGATHDAAWLLAVLALMQPDEAPGTTTLADAAALDPQSPSYLTALFHRARLLNGTPDAATLRPMLDAVLARTDLTATARNLFLAERLQLATSLADVSAAMLRQLQCTQPSDGCVGDAWGFGGTGSGLFVGDKGVGDDARYLIDRMGLSTRVTLSGLASLPTPIRIDIALTSFARAVLLHDDATADALARSLGGLLPVMADDFAAIAKAGSGPDKLFAEYFVFAKIPGLRADLLDYTRPEGKITDFQGSWPNWVVLARPDADAIPPGPALYDNAGYQVLDVAAGTDLGDGHRRIPDVVCDGMCGAGGFVPRMPAFLADTAAKATAERRFLPPPGKYGDPGTLPLDRAEAFPSDAREPVKAHAAPPGATYMWEFILDYATKHPQDPRSPEALHWLIHIGHYGQSHDHSGKRAFMLLHSRYPNSSWAKLNPFYYD
jgi:hypothetical protein